MKLAVPGQNPDPDQPAGAVGHQIAAPVAKPGLRFVALDSLRGICACMVVLYHFDSSGLIHSLGPIRHGDLFVDFFFVLSGFVIAAGYKERLGAGFPILRFMALRLGRIYPLHLFVLMAMVALELLNLAVPGLSVRAPFSGSRTLQGLFDNLLFLQTFARPSGLSWNNPAWSIAAEFWAYVLAAVICALAPRRVNLLMAAVVLASGTWLVVSGHGIHRAEHWGVVRCFYGFAMGMIAWSAYPQVRRWADRAGPAIMTGVELAVTVAVLVLISGPNFVGIACPPLFTVAVLVFAQQDGALSRLLLARPMELLGTLSYSIYLDHEFVQGRLLDVIKLIGNRMGTPLISVDPNGFKSLVVGPLAGDALTAAMLALVIGVAYVTYHLVELPAREWSRRLILRNARSTAPASPAPLGSG